MGNFKLSAPWVTLYREIQALFEYDSDVHVLFDEDEGKIGLFVDDDQKAEALATLLPLSKSFGNVSIDIRVIPANNTLSEISDDFDETTFYRAFRNNPILVNVSTVQGLSDKMIFVEFEPEVVQFYNDNTASLYGLTTTIYEAIANDIFELNGVFFSTTRGCCGC